MFILKKHKICFKAIVWSGPDGNNGAEEWNSPHQKKSFYLDETRIPFNHTSAKVWHYKVCLYINN